MHGEKKKNIYIFVAFGFSLPMVAGFHHSSPKWPSADVAKKAWDEMGRFISTATLASIMMSAVGTEPAVAIPPINCDSFGCYAAEQRPGAKSPPKESPPPVVSPSSTRALKVGKSLKPQHATMYGAYWCGFCDRERQALGKEAWAMVRKVSLPKCSLVS
jgi:hypothetical protein